MKIQKIFSVLCCCISIAFAQLNQLEGPRCMVPKKLHGTWFSLEQDVPTTTVLNETSMSRRGDCIDMSKDNGEEYLFIFKENNINCYHCVKMIIRTVNVIEMVQDPCVSLSPNTQPTIEKICVGIKDNQQLIILFKEDFLPISCPSFLEGEWRFTYQNNLHSTTDVCNRPDARIKSCQIAGSPFLIKKFSISYKQCEDMDYSFYGNVQFSCLGDWFVGNSHYFVVANTRESRKHEKYRCFLKDRDDDLNIGVSITAECNKLKTPEHSPEHLKLTPIKTEYIKPGCNLPQYFSGKWINAANINTDIIISETHINQTYFLNRGRSNHVTYVCRERHGNRVMMSHLSVDGCEENFVCFEFMPSHHNIIRYRTGLYGIKNDFNTLCSSEQFNESKEVLLLPKNPVPIRCPVAGKFNFTQKGENPFQKRILDGITLSPRPDLQCKQNISLLSVCDVDQKEITIDVNYCLAFNHLGVPEKIYSEPDYRMKCIGFWKENLKSYLITYNDLDPRSKYRCWVYQRTDLNRVLMSQSVNAYCNTDQNVQSWYYYEGADVAIDAIPYEGEHGNCPMSFDDGEKIDTLDWNLYQDGTRKDGKNITNYSN
ncbi:uncharacterized protein LOC119680002 isoform X2 [Teleopsis dalmanni]|uniref:uncharacterized protein LOC119680002 isoform X2 n=1 Tax=Teleopsis dalmanni TaxID=139649 RepID=UPI0018CECB9C|nr:uncharacterized protein LOC119680002 isoform X2 [Teleopsis dalmanni]